MQLLFTDTDFCHRIHEIMRNYAAKYTGIIFFF